MSAPFTQYVGDSLVSYNPNGPSTLTYNSPEGPLRFAGTLSACESQLAAWQQRYEGTAHTEDAAFERQQETSPPLDTKEYLAFVKHKLGEIASIIEAKNHDYTAGGSPFANFEITEQLGLGDAKLGLLIRLVDKIQRLKSFVKCGKLAVKNESASDAATDIVGYGLVLLGMLENDRRKAEASK